MPIFTKNDVSVLFIHIPKTGGTTIEDTFQKNGFEMTFRRGGAYGPRIDFDRDNGCSPQHMHAALLERHFAAHAFTHVFTVVRHPMARLGSEYRFRAANGHPLAGDGIDAFAQRVMWRFEKRNPMVLDNHIRPQVDFLWRSCETFRLEDGMNTVLQRISDFLGSDLTHAGLTSMKSDDAIPADLSPEAEAALRAFYRQDYEAFGYA